MPLEKAVGLYCAPALAGIKPSNLLSYVTKNKSNTKTEIACLNTQLNRSDIYIDILCEYENRLLILVYRRKKLGGYLKRGEIADFLKKLGYSTQNSLEKNVALLSAKISKSSEFPHEVGAFLGYPIEDIYGFINHKNCKYSGYWKVYGNVEQAKKLFKKYDSCRNAVICRMNKGKSLTDMFALVRI
ncbi:MAG: DUF3793 family protein [Firmicutes bacterium]|nr:DUF3793 family protein [Bacillota bacterium]